MVALRVALVIAWIVAQVVGVIVAVLVTRDGPSSPALVLLNWVALCGLPVLLGAGGLWLAERSARQGRSRLEALSLLVPLAMLVTAVAALLRIMA